MTCFHYYCYYFPAVDYIWLELALHTCSDHAEPYLSTGAVNVGRILDLADIRAVIGELDLLEDDGGVPAHYVPGPDDPLPENAIGRGIRPLLVVEDLERRTQGGIGFYVKERR